MKRKIENWLVLNISNLIAIPLQYSKGLELTSLLTVVYFIMGIAGYWKWRKIIKANSEVVAL
jgi:nicotinamide mononucleotide transporter